AMVALGVLVYTYVGYPLFVAALARLRSQIRAVRIADTLPSAPHASHSSHEPTVTVCMPVYNAEAHLAGKLETILSQDYPEDKLDVLVFSDGSTDKSDSIAEGFSKGGKRLRVLRSEARVGKPTALNRMRDEARGEVLLMTDARQPISRGAVRA